MKPISLFALTLLALSTTALTQAADNAEPAAPAPRPVLSQLVQEQHATAPRFVGVVSPRVSAAIAFRVGGTLVARQVDIGAQVNQGDVLANLDATTQLLAVQTARANLASADAQYANAAAAEGRLRTLNQNDVVSLANLEQAEQQTSGAQAALVQAQSRLRQTEEQLSYATLTAPFDGIVTAVNAEAGSVVAAGQMVITVADPTTRDVVIDLPETIIGDVTVGTEFTLSPQLSPDTIVTGQVREIAPQANPLTRAWRVKIGVESEVEDFWLGSTASASLGASSNHQITIPATAIKQDGATTGVWIVNEAEATVSFRPVTLGTSASSSLAIVTDGLDTGERVVIAGVNSLVDGQSILFDKESAK